MAKKIDTEINEPDLEDVEDTEELDESETEVEATDEVEAEPKILKFLCKSTIIHEGKVYLKDEEIILEKALAKQMHKRGLITPPQK